MSSQHKEVSQHAGGGADTAKLVLAIAILVGGVVGYYVLDQLHLLVRVGMVLAAAGVSGYLIYLTETGQRAWHFLQDTRKELRLVVWPTRKEVVNTTLMIIAVVIVMGIFLWLVDMFFLWLIEWLTGSGG